MGPVALLHRALLQHPYFRWSKAPFLTSRVSHSSSLLEQEAKAGAGAFFIGSLNKHVFAESK